MTLLTRIHQIEITSECNLACIYCPHPGMKRTKQHMRMDVFERALEWVGYFNRLEDSNQLELALTGIGEGLLHPDFKEMLVKARKTYNGFIHFSTNGVLFNEEIASLCNELQIGTFVSMHRPEKGALAAKLANDYGVLSGTNHAFVDSSIDWAGQVDWHVSAPKGECKYQKDGWGVVLVDGSITTCCMDSEGINIIGHIDDPIGSVEMEPKALCRQCHLEVVQ